MTHLTELPPKAQNAVRADWARKAVDVFGRETFGDTFSNVITDQPGVGDDPYCMAQDLISNLLHLAQQHGWDADELIDRAKDNFEHESSPSYPGD